MRPALILAAACALAAAGHARAEEAGQQQPAPKEDVYAGRVTKEYNPETAVFGPLPRWISEDGNFNIGGATLMQFDFGTYSQNAQGGPETSQALNPDLDPDLRARRAVFLLSGVFYDDFIVFASHDAFDPGDAVMDGLRSAVLAYRRFDPLWFLVGQQSLPEPLDAATFSSQRRFMEEAMSSGAFGFAPGTPSLGVSTMHRSKHHFIRLGLYGVPADEVGENSEGYGFHGRATYAPINERTRALHFGVSGYWRKPTVLRGEAGGTERFSARPELRIDDTSFVDTGDIPRINDFYFAGVELLGVYGPASVQAEYHRVGVNRYDGPHDAPLRDLTFDGYYVQAGYFLTGESPNFFPNFATLWRVQPFKELDPENGGWGAFEIAARYSHIDLDDGVGDLAGGGVRGGVADNFTVGLNWYLNALTRISLNYVHSNIDNLSDAGLNEGEVIDAVGVRLQWEF